MEHMLNTYITEIPDFPEEGVLFRDITTLIQNPDGFGMAIDEMAELLKGRDFDIIAGAESRGFIFGAALAYKLGKGFIPVRKPGKLPRETVSESYDTEYSTTTLEMHRDSLKPGERVVLIDDLIATGGTAEAVVKLVEKLGGIIEDAVFLIELAGLEGRKKLEDMGVNVEAVITYEGK